MSIKIQQVVNSFETEVVSPEMIDEVLSNCFVFADDGANRALEIITPEDVIVGANGSDLLDGETQEVETVEEISLKNGVYHEIRRKLCERYNIPPNEIAFIHEADTPAKKAALFNAVNEGLVRVLIGSTSKLGTGVNAQKRLIALHHLDEPWKPAELEQREGRILRQGNIYPEAFIFHYVTERSFDGYMLQTLESKARFISQIMAGEVTARTAEDVGDMVLTVAQVKAIASGNPLVQRRIELEVKLVKLDRLRASFYNNRAAMRADLEELPERITSQELEIKGHEKAIALRQPLKEDTFHITLKKNLVGAETVNFDKRERAGAQIRYITDLLTDRLRGTAGRGSLTEEVGTYRGFKVYVHASGNARLAGIATLFNFQSEIHLRAETGGTCYVAQIGESNVGITQSIDYQLRHIEDRLEQSRSNLDMLRSRLTSVQTEIDKPWAYVTEYSRLRREYEAIGNSLQADGIEVENNTTFTFEDETVENTDESSVTTAQAEAISVDELDARRNPFTGLEDWAITVNESVTNDFDYAELLEEIKDNNTLSFNFDAASDELAGEEEIDIFLSPPDEIKESEKAELNVTTAETDICYSSKPLSKPLSKKTKTKTKSSQGKEQKQSANLAQTGFLW